MIEVAKTILDRVTNLRNRGRVGALGQFYCGGGNELLVSNLVLPPDSYVIDAGGYEGEWTDEMLCRYGVTSTIYEPNPPNAAFLRERYAYNLRVKVIEAALWNRDGEWAFIQQGSGSTLTSLSPNTIMVRVVDAKRVVNAPFGCIKLNVEGAEYDILEKLIEFNRVKDIKYILVQFHQGPNCNRRREKIQLGLSLTHTCVFDYPFVWELWKLKPSWHT